MLRHQNASSNTVNKWQFRTADPKHTSVRLKLIILCCVIYVSVACSDTQSGTVEVVGHPLELYSVLITQIWCFYNGFNAFLLVCKRKCPLKTGCLFRETFLIVTSCIAQREGLHHPLCRDVYRKAPTALPVLLLRGNVYVQTSILKALLSLCSLSGSWHKVPCISVHLCIGPN